MLSKMTAQEFVDEHGHTFKQWLQDNTVKCDCEDKYGCDEARRRGDTIDADTEITCRRCYVPISLQMVSLRAPPPAPHPRAAVRKEQQRQRAASSAQQARSGRQAAGSRQAGRQQQQAGSSSSSGGGGGGRSAPRAAVLPEPRSPSRAPRAEFPEPGSQPAASSRSRQQQQRAARSSR